MAPSFFFYSMKRIGIFGGTFNPVHNAHIEMATRFIEQLNLDICYFVPTYITPFKIDNQNEITTTIEHRLKMLEFAVGKIEKSKISLYEIEKKGISYTFETVLYFSDKYPQSEIFVLIGGDQAAKFHLWKDYETILSKAQLCIAPRKNNTELDFIIKQTPIQIEMPTINISSTDIKEAIREGASIEEMLPKEISEYINKNKLYI